MSAKLTKGERRALLAVHAYLANKSEIAWTCIPDGVQWRTMENLCAKGLLKYKRGPYGGDQFYLTDEGLEVGDELAKVTA